MDDNQIGNFIRVLRLENIS